MVNRRERSKLCALMTGLCDQRISGKEFFNTLVDIEPDDDSTLELVIVWLLDAWDPEWPWENRFDHDDPPYRIRRQMALFRRLLLSELPYQWPEDAYLIDGYPMIRLWSAGLSISAAMLTIPVALNHFEVAPFAIAFTLLAVWLLRRERYANQRDWDRTYSRATEFGEPEWWPFLNGESFHAAGPSRSRLAS